MAQRRGGGGARGGSGGGGFRGGAGFSGFRGGAAGRSFGFRGFTGGYYRPYAYPAFGFGFSYWPSYYDYYPYTYPYSYPVYQPSPNVTVVYPAPAPAPAAPATVYVERARPVSREYHEYGQEVRPVSHDAAPIYLIAFQDQAIRAAEAYWVDGSTLHYVTLQHEPKQAPLDTVDRSLSLQLNRERRVPFQLPAR